LCSLSPQMDQPLLFSSRRTTSYCEPTFVFLQLASLPIEHKSQTGGIELQLLTRKQNQC
jgi:hypothetical protein